MDEFIRGHEPIRETLDRPINHGDPYAITQCPSCGIFYRNGEPIDKPVKSWLRTILENWWRYGWRIEVPHGTTLPIGYGVSWQLYDRMALAMHPIPFNIIMRVCREWFIWAVQGGWKKYPTKQDEIDLRVAQQVLSQRSSLSVYDYFQQQYGASPEDAWKLGLAIGPVDMCNFVQEYVRLLEGQKLS
jgi:hypothetical protein